MLYLATGTALLGLVIGGWGGYKATSLHFEHVIDKASIAARTAVDEANAKAARAGADYETWKAAQRPKTITITREIARAVQADSDCSAKPLPPSVRDALTAAATDADQFSAYNALPAASSARTYELGSPGAGLRGSSGGVGRLSAAPQVTR